MARTGRVSTLTAAALLVLAATATIAQTRAEDNPFKAPDGAPATAADALLAADADEGLWEDVLSAILAGDDAEGGEEEFIVEPVTAGAAAPPPAQAAAAARAHVSRPEGAPGAYERAMFDFHIAVYHKDYDTAHRICEDGKLFRKRSDPPAPRKAPRKPGTDERVPLPAEIINGDYGVPGAFDTLQCMLETRQVPARVREGEVDWFGLTHPKIRNYLVRKSWGQQHVGVALAFLDMKASPAGQPSDNHTTAMHALFSTNGHAHTLARTGLFPSVNKNGAAIAQGVSGIRGWHIWGDILQERFGDTESATVAHDVVDHIAAQAEVGGSQFYNDAITLANLKANIIYREYRAKTDRTYRNHGKVNFMGRTVFHVVAMANNWLALGPNYLDAVGAGREVLELKDYFGNTALDYARFRGCDEVGEILAKLTGTTYERAVSDKSERYVAPDVRPGTFETDNAGGWNTDIATDLLPEVGGASRCDIDERTDITALEFLTEYMLKDRPLALRGYAKNWPFRELWARENLMNARGDIVFDAGPIPYAQAYGVTNPVRNITLREYVDTHTGTPLNRVDSQTEVRNYIFDYPNKVKLLDSGGAELYDDIDVVPPFSNFTFPGTNITNMMWSPPDRIPAPGQSEKRQPVLQFFVGPPGSGAPPHFHGDAFNCLAYGAKRWLMAPPRDGFYSKVAPAQFIREERGNHPPLMECVQYAGDVLYVPDSWTHTVVNLQDNVGAAIEFDSMLAILEGAGTGVPWAVREWVWEQAGVLERGA